MRSRIGLRAHSILTLSHLDLQGEDVNKIKEDQNVKVSEKLVSLGRRLGILLPEPDDDPEEDGADIQDTNTNLSIDDAEQALRRHMGGGEKNQRKKTLKDRRKELASKPARPKPKSVCKFYMEGLCQKGDTCPFSHAVKPRRTAEEAKSTEICKFYRLGNCLRGSSCIYSHDLSNVPCRFYHLKGECSAGAACRFSHQAISEEARIQLRAEWS